MNLRVGEGSVDLKHLKKLYVCFQVSLSHFLILNLPSVQHTFFNSVEAFVHFLFGAGTEHDIKRQKSPEITGEKQNKKKLKVWPKAHPKFSPSGMKSQELGDDET